MRIEIDGNPAATDALVLPATSNYGHFTAMQVRGRRIRGLALHLARLNAGNHELFDTGLDGDRVRELVRHALHDEDDASVRVVVFGPEHSTDPSIMVTVRPPFEVANTPQRIKSVQYQRPLPHVKHLGGFGQTYFRKLVGRDGFDEALLVAPDGTIAETAIANIGFLDGSTIVWPDAPALHGITMQLLELSDLTMTRRSIAHSDLGSFRAAFVSNARGIAPVGQIDSVEYPVDVELMKTLTNAYESVAWDEI